jgi:predicted DNA binding protein
MEELTERQRTAIELAYFAGFFEWPRVSSGEDIAESMGVSAPTFHQHARKAQRKVFQALFDPEHGSR